MISIPYFLSTTEIILIFQSFRIYPWVGSVRNWDVLTLNIRFSSFFVIYKCLKGFLWIEGNSNGDHYSAAIFFSFYLYVVKYKLFNYLAKGVKK